MKSIYGKAENAQIITRIESLTSSSKAIWGKMSVDQMMKHTNDTIIVAFGYKNVNK